MISIIVPVYNVGHYLARCIDSIIHQTFEDFEVLLIDDGSTDKSGNICDEYALKDQRIKVIHKVNGGVSTARNAGLKNASGEYISFVDADDSIHPRFLELLYQTITSYNADIAFCDYKTRNNTIISDDDSDKPRTEVKEIGHIDYMYDRNHNNIFTKIYRSAILENHFFDPLMKYGEDAVFIDSLVYSNRKIKIVKINLSLYYYYIRDDSAVHTMPQAIGLQRFEWYIEHWNIFLEEYRHLIWEHAVRVIIRIRLEEYLTPAYDIVMSKWKYLSKQYIQKMWPLRNITLHKKIHFYFILNFFWLYRIFLILNDHTIIDYERMKKANFQEE